MTFSADNRPAINSIVHGINAGRFVVLGFRTVSKTILAVVKELGPQDQLGHGEMHLPVDCLKS